MTRRAEAPPVPTRLLTQSTNDSRNPGQSNARGCVFMRGDAVSEFALNSLLNTCYTFLMIDITNVRSLTDFQRNAREHIDRLKETGQAELLTVNGQAEVVVQSPEAYQQLLEDAELARSLRVIRQSLEDAKSGKTKPAKQVLETLAAKHGIELRR